MKNGSQWHMVCAAATVIAITLTSCGSSPRRNSSPITDSERLSEILEEVRNRYAQPAVAAAVIRGEDISLRGSVGLTVAGGDTAVREESRFHIGSITKSMTAVLIAQLVEEGVLAYDTTLDQVLPDISMHEGYRKVTIHDLLLNRGGIMPFQRTDFEEPEVVSRLFMEVPLEYADPFEQRRAVTSFALNRAPVVAPGTKPLYSNIGWAIAGHIAEVVSGVPYESLLAERVFQPLGMINSRIGGWPASEQEPSQPLGHYAPSVPGDSPVPQPLEDDYVLPEWMNPSGGVHCSIEDFVLYTREHLRGLAGRGKLLRQASYKTIHTAHLAARVNQLYQGTDRRDRVALGYGWGISKSQGRQISGADGSAGTFFARIIIIPETDLAFTGFTNCGSGSAALDEAVRLVELF